MADKIPVETIYLDRVEGPTKETGRRVAKSLAVADEFLRSWSRTSPKKGAGYDKTDFRIVWKDGETYEGRYDLQFEDGNKVSLLGPHVTGWLTFHAGLQYPEHMTREDYDRYLDQVGFGEGSEKRQEALRFLQEYEL